ncbi:hypothetical protein IQ238_05965 [Pleurocapsales cyanobacterium LEGE 06147]|nr:hypothetical protein [Pleurocapsales cyanobacterium LEGE 06147]
MKFCHLLGLGLAGTVSLVAVQPGLAEMAKDFVTDKADCSNPNAYGTSTPLACAILPWQGGNERGQIGRGIPRIRDLNRPATTVKDWMAREKKDGETGRKGDWETRNTAEDLLAQGITTVTGVQINQTEKD